MVLNLRSIPALKLFLLSAVMDTVNVLQYLLSKTQIDIDSLDLPGKRHAISWVSYSTEGFLQLRKKEGHMDHGRMQRQIRFVAIYIG